MPVPPPTHAKKVFETDIVSAYQWEQEMFDGSKRMFECYVRPDTTAIISFVDRETVLMTRQLQPGRPEPFWDAPGGRVDPGETLEEGARREFEEETGYRAGRMMEWWRKRHTGMTRFEQAIYVATDLVLTPDGNHEEDGEKIELVPMKWNEVIAMCLRGELRSPETALALLAMEYNPEDRKRLEKFLAS